MLKVSQEEFIEIALTCNLNASKINAHLSTLYPDMINRPNRVQARIESLRKRGLLPLDSGNSVSIGEILKGTSTCYDPQGNIKQQWVKTDVAKETALLAFSDAIDTLIERLPEKPNVSPPPSDTSLADLMSVYTIGDAHVGMLSWAPETGEDNDLLITEARHIKAMELLVAQSRPTKEAFIVDVGDFFHSDNTENRTAASGHSLDVDGRYGKVLELGLYLTAKLIDLALAKHDTVHWRSAIGELIAT